MDVWSLVLPAGLPSLPELPPIQMKHLDRRRFVQGLTGGALLLGAGRGVFAAAALAPRELIGPVFDLSIDTLPVNLTGSARRAVAVNGQLPAPLLRMRQGDQVTIHVTNRLREQTSIHWHGFIVPADMDGVPGLSFDGIAPGSTFTYRFKVNQYGTYWYHSHSRFQEQVGLYGPIVVERRGGERHPADREHVLLLSDWTDQDPEHIYATLKRQSDYYNFNKRTVTDFLDAARAEQHMWNAMRMDPTDLADVGGYAYTYLMNGASPAGNWTGTFTPGERVRLRIINGSSMSFFDLRIPGLKLTVVAADGQDVEPVTVDELRIGTAEVYDVIVEPRDTAYTIFAQSMDRSGFARGTLAPRAGMSAEVPPLDKPVLLTMGDMGMNHAGMDHSQMSHEPINHAPAESGPSVDMRATMLMPRLDDPGIGLRDNGRRVLTYSDLATLGGSIDARDAAREIELHLTGHMERYIWSFNGQKFSDAAPLRLVHGERLRVSLVNDTMMTHPIHLHGMWSELSDTRGAFLVRKHTVIVQPGQRLSYLVTADALGSWAYHCHLLYHMEAGMFREVVVA
jgi:FtsP/CotA-like multicopper oxidase with cupredoxin domain